MRWLNDTPLAAEIVCPAGAFDPAELLAQRPQQPFAEPTLAFITDFSNALLKDSAARRFPEVVALGFWMRRANIARIQSTFETAYAGRHLIGKGLVFHIAPANVDTMFVYSLFLSMIAGNTNIVRVSTKLNPQTACVLGLLSAVLERHPEVATRLLVVRYGHDESVTAFFSSLCNARLIWGGDETVSRVRAISLPPHAFELAFSGKFSVAVLDAAAWNVEPDPQAVAKAFGNDAFTFHQQGCASPKLLFWRGAPEDVARARASFWPAVERAAAEMPAARLEPAEVMDRFVAACSMAVRAEGDLTRTDASNRSFTCLWVSSLDDVLREAHTGNGLFYEHAAVDLDSLLAWFGDSDQTVSSHGIAKEEWEAALRRNPPKGICRIVRFGKALDFSPVWDGYDLIRYLCLEIAIEV